MTQILIRMESWMGIGHSWSWCGRSLNRRGCSHSPTISDSNPEPPGTGRKFENRLLGPINFIRINHLHAEAAAQESALIASFRLVFLISLIFINSIQNRIERREQFFSD
jgi:hypothetical protein